VTNEASSDPLDAVSFPSSWCADDATVAGKPMRARRRERATNAA